LGKDGKRKKEKSEKAKRKKLKTPPKGIPQCSPYLHYADPRAALEWLCEAFDLEERVRVPDANGNVAHAEARFGKALFMLGPASPEQGTRSPRDLMAVNQSLYVYVEDVDAHCDHARAAGATVSMEPQDMFWGDRVYSVRDCEGHHWMFAQHVRHVDPQDLPSAAGH
jgi:uncharacterized glyoxalase superfamily protein PhnB